MQVPKDMENIFHLSITASITVPGKKIGIHSVNIFVGGS